MIIFKTNIRTNDDNQELGNISFKIHPFFREEMVVIYSYSRIKDHLEVYQTNKDSIICKPISEEEAQLVYELWEKVPGCETIFLSNGELTIHHNLVFENNEVIEIAKSIITDFLVKRDQEFQELKKVYGEEN